MNNNHEALAEVLAGKLAPLVAQELARLLEQTPPPADPTLLDVAALAARLNVSARTVRRLDATGKIPQPIRIGRALRWHPDEIAAWEKENMPERNRWEAIRVAKKLGPATPGGQRR